MTSVVIVDDHAPFRRQVRRMLESAGFEVVGEASDAMSGVEEVARSNPAVVLMDVGLPDMDGFKAAELMDPTRVVLTSGRDARSLISRLAVSRVLGFLPKDQLTASALTELMSS